jgi:hypothetical protein
LQHQRAANNLGRGVDWTSSALSLELPHPELPHLELPPELAAFQNEPLDGLGPDLESRI